MDAQEYREALLTLQQLHTLCKCMGAFVNVIHVFFFFPTWGLWLGPTSRNAVLQFVLFLVKCQCIRSNRQVIVPLSRSFQPKWKENTRISLFQILIPFYVSIERRTFIFFFQKNMVVMNCSVMKSRTRSRVQSEPLFVPFLWMKVAEMCQGCNFI